MCIHVCVCRQGLGLRNSLRLYKSSQENRNPCSVLTTLRWQHRPSGSPTGANFQSLTRNYLGQSTRLCVSFLPLRGTSAITPGRSTAVGIMEPLACENGFCIVETSDKHLYLCVCIFDEGEPVTALRFSGCHNQSELYLSARDQSCLSNHSCLYILDMLHLRLWIHPWTQRSYAQNSSQSPNHRGQ